jgi:hypothetical protein
MGAPTIGTASGSFIASFLASPDARSAACALALAGAASRVEVRSFVAGGGFVVRTRRRGALAQSVALVLAGLLVLVGVLLLGACGGDEKDVAETSAASATAPAGEPIVIRATLIVAAEEGSEWYR